MHLQILCRLVLALFVPAISLAETHYSSVGQIPIGGEGGWDILTVDAAARRLYLSHATKVVVVDIDANKVVGEIPDTPGVHAFLPLPQQQRGISSNGQENKCSVVDLKTLTTVSKVDTGNGPDAMAYDSNRGEVYVFNHKGNSATVIDLKEWKVVATIPLEGSPEFGVADPVAGRVYCNLEDKNEVAVIDTAKHQVVANWPLAPGTEPTGIALDAEHHRLFSTCNNKLMTMIDTRTGKVMASVPIGEHVDGCAFDPTSQLVFASCGEGVTTIAKVEGDQLKVLDNLKTERGARTIALDPKTHRIFLPTAQFQPPPSPAPGMTPGRPAIVPNTLKLLVYGPSETTKP
jgi:YVTN family beta-propeller protein